ncbi:ACP phosphodiesterase [Marinoscillum sp.]|uniref:acyl carrier protein phosphodiesterase n=1 Tax=Marinoscillum sp. TaxID=2024838 RepID=UPI003BA90191
MNFLAHVYLSFEDPEILVGNFIGDFVKGKAVNDYDGGILKGILLHREIDEYTDSHPTVLETKKRLRPIYHHYAPVIADVFYDHFLASLWTDYHTTPLLEYTNWAYSVIKKQGDLVPPKARHMLTYMARDNWLYNYQHIAGIDQALTGMSRRTPFNSGMEHASEELQRHYEAYKAEFVSFFPKLITHCQKKLESL